MPPTPNPLDPLLTDREAAALLRIGVSTLRRHVARGLAPRPLKLGGCARWARSDLLEVVDRAKAQRTKLTSTREGV